SIDQSTTANFGWKDLHQGANGIRVAGDVTGTHAATTVGALQGRAVAATAPANGQVLAWNGTQWAPSAAAAGTVTSVTASAPLASSGGNAPNISLTGIVPIANGGTGSVTQNFVDLSSAQTVTGVKTFSSTISGNISGSAASFTGALAGDV